MSMTGLPAEFEGLIGGGIGGILVGYALHLPGDMTGMLVVGFAIVGFGVTSGLGSKALDVAADILDSIFG